MNGFMQIPSEAPRPHRAEPRLSVAVLSVCLFDDPADLLPYTAAWEKLAAQALEPNVFYEPWMLLPALEAYGAGEELLFALVFEGEPQSRLVGFFPLQRRRLHRRLPVSILGLWRHIHCYLCTPLVRPDCASAVLAALLDTLNTDPRGASVVEFNHVLGSGPFSALLQASFQTRENPTIVLGSHERALFRPRGDGEHYLRSALPGKRRRALQRRERRLAERGAIDYKTLERGDDVEAWAEGFLRLEAAGWKGKSGTALPCNPVDRRYFRTIVDAAFARSPVSVLNVPRGSAHCFSLQLPRRRWRLRVQNDLRRALPQVFTRRAAGDGIHPPSACSTGPTLDGFLYGRGQWHDESAVAMPEDHSDPPRCHRSVPWPLPGRPGDLATRPQATSVPSAALAYVPVDFGRGSTSMNTSPLVDHPRSASTTVPTTHGIGRSEVE